MQQRAHPEALLSQAAEEGRGRLRVFMGAAPGVGKTYAMLQAARAARAEGADVVVGVVETHGRPETQQLLDGIEVLPRRPIFHRGRLVPEFDLEAALARRPGLLLVDEYAHSNVPGSRHPKRWQDVEELLDAGIDVWTTLNVQHVESLNDVVQRITSVRVRETVPDAAFQHAHEIVLVDLPPAELLKRLADGKVYVQDTATRAVQSFFKPSNLLALRELALRRVAARVDSDLVERMQGGAIEGPWAAGERIMVCVGPDGSALRVVREAKRLADLLGGPWFAVTVERPGRSLDAKSRARIAEALRLAESLGGEIRQMVAADLAGELLRFARFQNITQIVIGQARPGRIRSLFQRTLADALVRSGSGIAVHVLTSTSAPGESARWMLPPPGTWRGYLVGALGVAAVVLVGLWVEQLVPLPNISMLFLMAVLVPAIRFGVWPAVFASFLSFFAYNFFFISPVRTFSVARPHELLALGIFLLIAVLTSALAGRAREQADAAILRMRATRRLFEFTRKLSALAEERAVAEAAAAEISTMLDRAVVILRAGPDGLAPVAAAPAEDRLDTASLTAARWAFDHDEPAGADTGTLPNAPWLFLPLRQHQRRLGVIGIEVEPRHGPLDSELRGLLDTLAGQTAIALERAGLARETTDARMAAETERVRNLLLASISHDFRTPLSSVLGAASSLLDYGQAMSEAERQDLLAQVREEAEHLDGMVRNLLSMTRLEAGSLDLRRDWVDLEEVLNRAVAVARRRGATQRFRLEIEAGLPLVFADQSLLHQAIGNVVGNAVRHAGPDANVLVAAGRSGPAVQVTVSDDGPGVDPALLPQVFDKFVRAGRDGGEEGFGLGLAITRGILEAHGGSVEARPALEGGRGLRMVMTLPIGGPD
ncbi:sensor histidine kinase [Geminicoccus roseus]|uniref:sensor histidine kinase n=1 Tax=Geminicoccus roseus TaxID=404900 RepID=UPI00041148D3|nr:sensor histidine kinase KdpD [Geminicoccus roseus]